MSFRSILFEESGDRNSQELLEPPPFFHDLNLDQIVDSITSGREEYNLKPFFYNRLTDLAGIVYRQQIMRDLENKSLFESIKSFSGQMRVMRGHLTAAENRYYKYSKERWFLDAVEIYCEAVKNLLDDLNRVGLNSRGMLAFREYLAQYAESSRFKTLLLEAKKLKSDLSAIKYSLLINGNRISVRNYESEIDYSMIVEKTFSKFKQGAAKDYDVKLSTHSGMGHVEAKILDLVAQLNPDIFQALDDYCAKNKGHLDETVINFDREIQFYLAYMDYMQTFDRAGLKFCYPQISDTDKNISNCNGFDLALAIKLIRENRTVVCNNFFLTNMERIFVITGPNQGGKTTFARSFGQLHYLASLGCTVPGTEARLFLFDQFFTHFERQEDITNLRGKLQDDLFRIHQILTQATPKSIVIINEIFSSTSVKDGVYLGRRVLENLLQLDLLCVCVTFLDELSCLSEKVVSLVAAVVPDNPTLRTYRIERRPADGLAYALALAEKHRLTYDRLRERLRP
ncbi:MAG TPA: DNA mismatch repair protein MutS [Phycisphaerae bacterium]|nr:DNA mismatch repair protein MutS [Phycisphaerae bacterium]